MHSETKDLILGWVSIGGALTSLGLIQAVKCISVFRDGNVAGMMIIVSILTAVVSLLAAIASARTRLLLLTLALLGLYSYFLLFTRLYWVM